MMKLKDRPRTEKSIQTEIRIALGLMGWRVYRIHQSLGSHKGFCDLIAIKGGKVLFIEVKTMRGKQSPYQEQFQREIEQAGGTYILARSVEDVERGIK